MGRQGRSDIRVNQRDAFPPQRRKRSMKTRARRAPPGFLRRLRELGIWTNDAEQVAR